MSRLSVCSPLPFAIFASNREIWLRPTSLPLPTCMYSWWVTLPSRNVELNPETKDVRLLPKWHHISFTREQRQQKLSTCKYVLTKIDNLRCFTYTTPCKVEKTVKYIRMAIVEPNPAERCSKKHNVNKSSENHESRNCPSVQQNEQPILKAKPIDTTNVIMKGR